MFHELENNCTLKTSLGSNSQSPSTPEAVCKREICSENLLTWRHETSWFLSRVVCQKLEREHVSAECESDITIGRREVVRVRGDGVLLAVVLMFSKKLEE
jgi:hypothetical protein